MAFSNTDYLYQHLPARMRRDDTSAFLKRYISWIGNELDGVDQKYDQFYLQINPGTATSDFIDWWLYALFGWGWFPTWFTLDERRAFYAHMTQHLARRGTAIGIQKFLADFGVGCVVEKGPAFYGDTFWGDRGWLFSGPNVMVVRLFPQLPAVPADASFFSETAYGDEFYGPPGQNIGTVDVDALLRWEWPEGCFIFIESLPIGGLQQSRNVDLLTQWNMSLPVDEYGEGQYGISESG
jgi:hypothetical protein